MINIENALVLAIDFQEKLMHLISENEEVTRKSSIFFQGCRILEVPILTTQQYTKGLGETIPAIKDALGDFEPVEKITFSCYRNAEFRDRLEKSGKNDIIVTGIEAHICVQQTVLDLLDNGYSVFVLVDCVSSRFATDRKFSTKRMSQAGAVFTTMESALFELMVSADHPRRKEISNLVK